MTPLTIANVATELNKLFYIPEQNHDQIDVQKLIESVQRQIRELSNDERILLDAAHSFTWDKCVRCNSLSEDSFLTKVEFLRVKILYNALCEKEMVNPKLGKGRFFAWIKVHSESIKPSKTLAFSILRFRHPFQDNGYEDSNLAAALEKNKQTIPTFKFNSMTITNRNGEFKYSQS